MQRFVYSVQSYLKFKGFNPGPLDGILGPKTVHAWNAFLDAEEGVTKPSPTSPQPPEVRKVSTPAGTDRFKTFIQFILKRECAYAPHSQERIPEDVITENVPGDNGGPTKFGIDQASHPSVNVRNLTLEQAEAIYYQEWINHKCDKLPSPLGEIVFDASVTGGKPVAWLQKALNEVDKAGLQVDGGIGGMTIGAAEGSLNKKAVGSQMLAYRDEYFRSLGETYPHDRKFVQGWINRDNELRNWITAHLA